VLHVPPTSSSSCSGAILHNVLLFLGPLLHILVAHYHGDSIPRPCTPSSAAWDRTTHLVCSSCRHKLEHVQTRLGTWMDMTRHIRDRVRTFREWTCTTTQPFTWYSWIFLKISFSYSSPVMDKRLLSEISGLCWFSAVMHRFWPFRGAATRREGQGSRRKWLNKDINTPGLSYFQWSYSFWDLTGRKSIRASSSTGVGMAFDSSLYVSSTIKVT
jgi:hypothetical protein